MADPIRDLAAALAADQPAPRLRSAVITAVDLTAWTATVLLSGGTVTAGPLPCLGSYLPAVGDTVQVLAQSPASMLVLGPADLMLKPEWEIRGGNGQPVPTSTATPYTNGAIAPGSPQGLTSLTANPATAVIAVPGRYLLEWSVGLNNGGAAAQYTRQCFIAITPLSGAVRRVEDEELAASASGLAVVLNAAGTRRLAVGDSLTAWLWQTSGATININDPAVSVTSFCGYWLGP